MRSEIYTLTQLLRSRAYPIQVSQDSVLVTVEDEDAVAELSEIARELGLRLDHVRGEAWPEGQLVYAFRIQEQEVV